MGFFGTIGISILISNAAMAIIMINGGKAFINIIWSLFCTCVSILGLSLFYISLSDSAEDALNWWRIAYLGIANLPVLLLHTTLLLIDSKSKLLRITLLSSYIVTSGFYLLNLYGIFIPEVTYLFGEIYLNTPYSISFIAFFIFFIALLGVITRLLITTYRDSQRFDKDLILNFSLGIGIGILGYSSILLPVFGIDIYPYLSVLLAIYPLVIGFSILNHHLFNAKYSFIQLLKVVTVWILSVLILWGTIWILAYFFDYRYELKVIEVLVSGVFIGVFVLLFRNKTINNIFLLESLRDLRRETRSFLDRTSVFTDQSEFIKSLEEYFWNSLRINKVELLDGDSMSKFVHTVEYFHKNSYPLIRGNISKNPIRMTLHQRRLLGEEIEKIGNIIFPIEGIKGKRGNFIVLGGKESEKPFDAEEIETIQSILPKIALALQILDFNHSLQKEVECQTKVLETKNQELEKAYAQLKEIDQNKDNFLAIASHELRTPMTIIKGYADLFLNNALGPLNENERQYMKKIYDSTESLINMVNNILDISKIEAGRMDIKCTPINIHEVIKKSVNDFESIYEEKNIGLFLTDTSTINIISTDEEKIRLVMNNLLSNACKFTHSGGEVHVSVSNTGNTLQIRVCDTGIGISEIKIKSIFEKFSESNNNDYTKKSIRGTGLGLNLSKQVIDLLGGSIIVSSEEGKGSCFEFTLPL